MMEYKRLTKRTSDGGVKYRISKQYEHYRIVYPKGNEDSLLIDTADRLAIRLAELEDKIELGTLKEIGENMIAVLRAEYNDLKGLEKRFDDYLIKEIVETRKEALEKVRTMLSDFLDDYALFDKMFLKRKIDEICKKIMEGKV